MSGHLPPLYSKKEFEVTKEEYLNASKIIGINTTEFLKVPATKIQDITIAELNKNLFDFVKKTDPSVLLIPFLIDT